MQGVIAAVPTPYDPSGTPEKSSFLEHCSWALANGCDGLNILGSTGEANALSTAARMEVMRWTAEALDKDKLMVGTGTPSLAETIVLTRHAADLGYSVALVLPPYYYKPASDAGLIAWYSALHDALPAGIEIYFYNFPQMTGITIPVDVIATLAERFPARFTGIKDSSGDLDYCRALVARNANLAVFPSSETALAQAHASGFAGCISATTNITGALSAQVWQNRDAPDAATLDVIGAQRAAIAGAGLIPAIKSLVGHRSGAGVWQNILPPFAALETDARDALLGKLQQ